MVCYRLLRGLSDITSIRHVSPAIKPPTLKNHENHINHHPRTDSDRCIRSSRHPRQCRPWDPVLEVTWHGTSVQGIASGTIRDLCLHGVQDTLGRVYQVP